MSRDSKDAMPEEIGSRRTGIGTPQSRKVNDELEIGGRRSRAALARDENKQASKPDVQIAAPRNETLEPRPKPKRRSSSSTWRPLIGIVLVALVMIALTVLTFQFLPRYQQVGEALLADPPLSIGFEGWQQRGIVEIDPTDPGHVVLENDDPNGKAFLRREIALPPGPKQILLSADIETERVVAGEELWQRARVYFARLDETGNPIWSEPHNLFRLRGNKSKRTVTQVFSIPASVDRALLSLSLNNATGRMTVGDLKLIAVEEQPVFRLVKFGLIGAWGLLLIHVAAATFRSIQSIEVRLWLGGMAGVFLVALLVPGAIRNQLVEGLPIIASLGLSDPDVVGHAVVFAIMAGLVRRGRPDDPFWLHVGLWMLVGVATEVMQLFTLDRQASVIDFSVDVAGMLLGLTLAELLPSVFSSPASMQHTDPMSG